MITRGRSLDRNYVGDDDEDMMESEEGENDLQRMQRNKREEDALRAQGKPTLRVSLGDIMKLQLAAKRRNGPL